MALKAILKSLEGLSDETKKLYVKKGDDYHLDVEDLPEDPKLAEFRDNNRKLNKDLETAKEALKQFDGIDVTKYKEYAATQQKLTDKQLIEAGKIDELLDSKLKPIKDDFQAKLTAEETKNRELNAQLERMAIDDQLTKIGLEKGVLPSAVEDLRTRGRAIFKLKEGQVVPIGPDGTIVRNTKGEPLSIPEWADQLAANAGHLFQPSTGSGARGNGSGRATGTAIAAGDPVAFGQNLEKIAKGEVTVQR